MSKWKEIEASNFKERPFQLIGKDWMLISAKKEERTNCMTASWGGMGVMWNKNAVFIVVRDSRFSKEFLDYTDTFSLTFFDHERYAKMLQYMGTVSGRDQDKIQESGLILSYEEETPYFEEASIVMFCKKMCCQPIKPENYTEDWIDRSFYKDKDYHNLYIGEITKIISKVSE